MIKKVILSLLVCLVAAGFSTAATPSWIGSVDSLMTAGEFSQASQLMKRLPKGERRRCEVQIDSLNTIMERIRKDFNMTPEQGLSLIRERVPDVTTDQVERWKSARKIEYMTIDGREWWFRKSVRNLWLLAEEFKATQQADAAEDLAARRAMYLEAMATPADAHGCRDPRRVTVTFWLDVNADAVPAGEILRVWMPWPYENMRQHNIKMLSSNRPVTYSEGTRHHTVYMEATAVKGQPTHFEYTFAYDVSERHIAQQDLLAMLEPYNTSDPDYIYYTGNDGPHIQITDDLRALAREIVGDETNPVLQAAMVYRWISRSFPWAGAREYSTIKNMPHYVLLNKHGDCGQVTLLYISLVRSLGIPARWESGWWIEPGAENWHDWAETYFEGIGWVPTDQSYGRSSIDTPLDTYYASGIDLYRMASNEAVGDPLSPAKKYIRSETVDFQPGEVEWKGGNLYYDHWKSHLRVDSMEKIIPANR